MRFTYTTVCILLMAGVYALPAALDCETNCLATVNLPQAPEWGGTNGLPDLSRFMESRLLLIHVGNSYSSC
jgi:hypothetical protein